MTYCHMYAKNSYMQLTRTTLRLKTNIKKAAEQIALRDDRSLQDVFNEALETYVQSEAKKKAQKIVFKTHDLGEPLDLLTRSDYYPKP